MKVINSPFASLNPTFLAELTPSFDCEYNFILESLFTYVLQISPLLSVEPSFIKIISKSLSS